MIKINKIITPEVFKKGIAITGLATSTLAIINSRKETSRQDTLDYIEHSPVTLANKLLIETTNPIKPGESVEDFFERMRKGREVKTSDYEFDIDFESFDFEEKEPILDKTVLEEHIEKFKNDDIKKAILNIYNNECLYDTTVEILYDIEVKSQNIKDENILQELKKIFKEVSKARYDEETYLDVKDQADILIQKAYQIVEAYNTIVGNYVQYKKIDILDLTMPYEDEASTTQEYLETRDIDFMITDEEDEDYDENVTDLRQNLEKKIFKNENFSDLEVDDFIWAQKCEAFEALRCEPELKQYLYKILLKELNIPESAQKTCLKILEDYDVMVIPSQKSHNYDLVMEEIRNELESWRNASNNKAKFPTIISMNSIKKVFLNNAAGFYDKINNLIGLKNGYFSIIRYALRHEIMHLNDPLRYSMGHIGEEQVKLLAKIMPTKNVKGRIVRDLNNCMYREEFLKAGVDPDHINYAYENRAEFLAVAAEGDTSRFSPEFKEILLKLGMPEFVFNLKNTNSNISENCNIYDKIKKEAPEITDYKTLQKLCLNKKMEIELRKNILLKELFNLEN